METRRVPSEEERGAARSAVSRRTSGDYRRADSASWPPTDAAADVPVLHPVPPTADAATVGDNSSSSVAKKYHRRNSLQSWFHLPSFFGATSTTTTTKKSSSDEERKPPKRPDSQRPHQRSPWQQLPWQQQATPSIRIDAGRSWRNTAATAVVAGRRRDSSTSRESPSPTSRRSPTTDARPEFVVGGGDAETGSGGKCTSCPDLADGVLPLQEHRHHPIGRKSIWNCTGSDGGGHRAAKTTAGSSTAVGSSSLAVSKLLTVPSVFVTSFTRSSLSSSKSSGYNTSGGSAGDSADPSSTTSCTAKNRNRSAPDLMRQALQAEDDDVATAAAAKSSSMRRRRSTDILGTRRRTSSINVHGSATGAMTPSKIWHVTDFLDVGNLAAAYDERLLCRSSIAGIVDLSGVDPGEARTTFGNRAPCNCSREEGGGCGAWNGGGGHTTTTTTARRRHMLSVLRLAVSDTDLDDVRSCFVDINRFLEGSRRAGRRVLVVCRTGNTWSVLVVAQYLITVLRLRLDEARRRLAAAGCDADINEAFCLLLASLETEHRRTDDVDHGGDVEEEIAVRRRSPIASDLPEVGTQFGANRSPAGVDDCANATRNELPMDVSGRRQAWTEVDDHSY